MKKATQTTKEILDAPVEKKDASRADHLNEDFKNAVFVMSLLANLYALTTWVTYMVI